MFVIENKIKIKKGNVDSIKARLEHLTNLEKVPGFLELNVLHTRVTDDDNEEIVIWSKWESQEAHNKWVTSDMFKKAHSGERSDYIVHSNITFYDVVADKYKEKIENEAH